MKVRQLQVILDLTPTEVEAIAREEGFDEKEMSRDDLEVHLMEAAKAMKTLEELLRYRIRRWYELGGEEWRVMPAEQREEEIQIHLDALATKLVAEHFGCSPEDL